VEDINIINQTGIDKGSILYFFELTISSLSAFQRTSSWLSLSPWCKIVVSQPSVLLNLFPLLRGKLRIAESLVWCLSSLIDFISFSISSPRLSTNRHLIPSHSPTPCYRSRGHYHPCQEGGWLFTPSVRDATSTSESDSSADLPRLESIPSRLRALPSSAFMAWYCRDLFLYAIIHRIIEMATKNFND